LTPPSFLAQGKSEGLLAEQRIRKKRRGPYFTRPSGEERREETSYGARATPSPESKKKKSAPRLYPSGPKEGRGEELSRGLEKIFIL